MSICMRLVRLFDSTVWFSLPHGYVLSIYTDELDRREWAITHPDITGLQTKEIYKDAYGINLYDDVQGIDDGCDLIRLHREAWDAVETAIRKRQDTSACNPQDIPDASFNWSDMEVPF